MTTIIGIKSNVGVEGIVLGTDKQLGHYDETDELNEKESISKTKYGKRWVMSYYGGVSNQFSLFQKCPDRKMEKMIKKAVRNYQKGSGFLYPHFCKVNQINTISKRNGSDLDCLQRFILATNMCEEIDLWEVDIFGNLKQPQKTKGFEYLSGGSGSEMVDEYIGELLEKGKIDQCKVDISSAIDIVNSSLRKAGRQDRETSESIDLAVLTRKGIDFYHDPIYEASTKAIDEVLESIKNKYK